MTKLVPNTLNYYAWDDFQLAICEQMGIPNDKFREYHNVVFPDIEDYATEGSPYYDCWHVWIEVFDANVRNDSYSSLCLFGPDEPGNTDGEWGYIEERAVKEYGEWSRTFVKAVSRVIQQYNLADKELVIYYSW